MTGIIKQSADVILSTGQLKELEKYQSRLAGLSDLLGSCTGEFAGIIDRHYFNRENGFLDDQQKNLREVVLLQSSIDKLAGSLAERSQELKSFMMNLQTDIQGGSGGAGGRAVAPGPAAPEENKPPQAGEPAAPGVAEEATAKAGPSRPPVAPKQEEGKFKPSPLVLRSATGDLMDGTTSGGEISIKRFINELALRDPGSREVLYQIDNQLRELLYNRKLVGYSASSIVFGRDKTLDCLIKELEPIFLSSAMRDLLVSRGMVTSDEQGALHLACDKDHQLIYLLAG
ncbi:MAG: hypothetical protein U9P14_06195 [Gemmatimonadota bacterium]|nr:hypothetical protein [Gemmatimonadota bacterium]